MQLKIPECACFTDGSGIGERGSSDISFKTATMVSELMDYHQICPAAREYVMISAIVGVLASCTERSSKPVTIEESRRSLMELIPNLEQKLIDRIDMMQAVVEREEFNGRVS